MVAFHPRGLSSLVPGWTRLMVDAVSIRVRQGQGQGQGQGLAVYIKVHALD